MIYPIIQIPKKVFAIKSSMNDLVILPKKPEYPQKKIPIKPKEVLENNGGGADAILIVVVVLGFGILLSSIKLPFGGFLVICGIVLMFYYIFNWNNIGKQNRTDYLKYLEDLKDYNHLLFNSEEIYNNEIEEYKTNTLPIYNADYYIHNFLNDELQTEENILLERNEKLIDFFKDVELPINIENDIKYTKGVTEDFFLKFLQKHFNGVILTNHAIINSEFTGIPFKPDFVLINNDYNVIIDLEIDEPYIGRDGTPIHLIDGNDKYRNEFFTDKNWIVIRFAEIQIVKFPEICCEIINATVEMIMSDQDLNLEILKSKIENFKCWDKNEANRLAYIRFRNKYLPSDLIEKVDLETMELEQKFLNTKFENSYDDLPF